ncbi:type I-E CRISPR-associated protein Cse2/CasB [Streptomyces sp. NBC_00006]|uniref:type I-E CRISPR-associated protein Cse2/CasB n=1 Tax=Streptomyces sp. NBC_00006 TaxID=2975619 RepID=UPI0022505F22|nr:type I-E CRISPR-associated protein Cse2/CasB [Streptomyces sp. NBC_00006]MCX5535179.1 type I-E CRISPR-associated protein Cse2/CasB [Streptomyces sp. NBC_00006]
MTSPPTGSLALYERFMGTVRRACATPEGRTALTQGLVDGLDNPWQLYLHLMPAGGIPVREDTPDPQRRRAEQPFLLVACLYAVHDAPNPKRIDNTPRTIPAPRPAAPWENLGWSLARAVRAGMRRETATGLLTHVCDLDYDALVLELGSTTGLLRSQNVPVRWPVLVRDLARYQRWPQDVRIDWARAYTTPASARENAK